MAELAGTTLLASTLVGCLGLALFVYGKKELRVPQLVVGMAMMTYPYFVASPAAILGIAAALVGLLFGASRLGI